MRYKRTTDQIVGLHTTYHTFLFTFFLIYSPASIHQGFVVCAVMYRWNSLFYSPVNCFTKYHFYSGLWSAFFTSVFLILRNRGICPSARPFFPGPHMVWVSWHVENSAHVEFSCKPDIRIINFVIPWPDTSLFWHLLSLIVWRVQQGAHFHTYLF